VSGVVLDSFSEFGTVLPRTDLAHRMVESLHAHPEDYARATAFDPSQQVQSIEAIAVVDVLGVELITAYLDTYVLGADGSSIGTLQACDLVMRDGLRFARMFGSAGWLAVHGHGDVVAVARGVDEDMLDDAMAAVATHLNRIECPALASPTAGPP